MLGNVSDLLKRARKGSGLLQEAAAEAARLPDQTHAPPCPGGMDEQAWLLYCEAGERCWKLCTDAPCLYLDVEGA